MAGMAVLANTLAKYTSSEQLVQYRFDVQLRPTVRVEGGGKGQAQE